VSSGEQNTLTILMTATRSGGMYINGFIIAASDLRVGMQVVVKTKLIEQCHSK